MSEDLRLADSQIRFRTFSEKKGASDLTKALTHVPPPEGPDTHPPPSSHAMPYLEDLYHAFEQAGALEPPFTFESMLSIYEQSSILPQNIRALSTNIDGFGYHLTPTIDPNSEEADIKIASMIRMERAFATDGVASYSGEGRLNIDPTPEEVQQRKQQLIAQMHLEQALVELFFESCSRQISFVRLRKETREELEITGNAFWEVLRNERGEIDSFNRIPAYSMRLLPIDRVPIECTMKIRVSATQCGNKKMMRNFRRFVQIAEGRSIFFKEFGDPRVVSTRSGKCEEIKPETPDADGFADRPATEIIHFQIPSYHSPYGVPRWVGVLLAVLGTSAAEEVNYLYFDNKSIPPLALLVSGAHCTPGTIKSIEGYIENEFKGRANFHKILVLEAEASPMAGSQSTQVRMVLQPLTSAQQRDGLFQKYIGDNRDFVGQAFRLPKIITGNTKDFTRASLEGALRFAEQQVFQPERQDFDDFINRLIFLEMGWATVKYTSNSPLASDPQTMMTMIQGGVIAGVLTPEDGRKLCSLVFNQDFAKISSIWTKQPLSVTLAMLGQGLLTAQDITTAPRNAEEARTVTPPVPTGETPNSESHAGTPVEVVTPPPPGQESRQPNAGQVSTKSSKELVDFINKSLEAQGHPALESETLMIPADKMNEWFPK